MRLRGDLEAQILWSRHRRSQANLISGITSGSTRKVSGPSESMRMFLRSQPKPLKCTGMVGAITRICPSLFLTKTRAMTHSKCPKSCLQLPGQAKKMQLHFQPVIDSSRSSRLSRKKNPFTILLLCEARSACSNQSTP